MNISVIPQATEKAYGQVQKNIYVFTVPVSANKDQIAQAVAQQFDVDVVAVRTLVQSGKAVRFSRGKGKYPGTTNRQNRKKAYVTLAKGNSIKVFDEPAPEATKEETK